MPAVRKVSKEQIINAAVEVLRDDGFSAINARSAAKKPGCSTQPICFSLKSMDELKAVLTQRAIEPHTACAGFSAYPRGERQQLRHGLRQIRRRGKAAVPPALSGGRTTGGISKPCSDAEGHRRDRRCIWIRRGRCPPLSSGGVSCAVLPACRAPKNFQAGLDK